VKKQHHDFTCCLERSRIPENELAKIATFEKLQQDGRYRM